MTGFVVFCGISSFIDFPLEFDWKYVIFTEPDYLFICAPRPMSEVYDVGIQGLRRTQWGQMHTKWGLRFLEIEYWRFDCVRTAVSL